MKSLLAAILTIFCTSAFALVDYSGPDDFSPKNSSAVSVKKKSSKQNFIKKKTRRSNRRSNAGPSMFNLNTSYQKHSIALDEKVGDVAILNLAGRMQTNYNIFIDFNFYQGQIQSGSLSEDSSYQNGNAEFKVGFNWLQFGNQEDAATVNFIGGVSMGQKNSYFAHSRTDKIVGVETIKRFFDFGLALGYELRLTGNPSSDTELDIGNISILSASIGWAASSNIRFVVEGGTVKINASSNKDSSQGLQEKISFGYIAPKLQLGLSPLIDFELGANFRSKRLNEDTYLNAKLWDSKGSYSNSIHAGLSLSI